MFIEKHRTCMLRKSYQGVVLFPGARLEHNDSNHSRWRDGLVVAQYSGYTYVMWTKGDDYLEAHTRAMLRVKLREIQAEYRDSYSSPGSAA